MAHVVWRRVSADLKALNSVLSKKPSEGNKEILNVNIFLLDAVDSDISSNFVIAAVSRLGKNLLIYIYNVFFFFP